MKEYVWASQDTSDAGPARRDMLKALAEYEELYPYSSQDQGTK